MTQEPIDFAEILAKGDTPPKRKTQKSKKVDITNRTVTTWFKLPHTYGICENPDCLDERPLENNETTRHAMTADVNDRMICRICFISGY